jgi:Fur family ferric uptake transcriptional regulator
MKHECKHDHHDQENAASLAEKLRARSLKVTGPRQAILEVLTAHPHPLTNKQVLQALPEKLCDLATVYRSMHMLETMGLVKRFDFGDGIARFELIHNTNDAHHHHLICTQCSAVVEVEECFPRELEDKIASGNGFKAVTHKLEFFGVCPQCQ